MHREEGHLSVREQKTSRGTPEEVPTNARTGFFGTIPTPLAGSNYGTTDQREMEVGERTSGFSAPGTKNIGCFVAPEKKQNQNQKQEQKQQQQQQQQQRQKQFGSFAPDKRQRQKGQQFGSFAPKREQQEGSFAPKQEQQGSFAPRQPTRWPAPSGRRAGTTTMGRMPSSKSVSTTFPNDKIRIAATTSERRSPQFGRPQLFLHQGWKGPGEGDAREDSVGRTAPARDCPNDPRRGATSVERFPEGLRNCSSSEQGSASSAVRAPQATYGGPPLRSRLHVQDPARVQAARDQRGRNGPCIGGKEGAQKTICGGTSETGATSSSLRCHHRREQACQGRRPTCRRFSCDVLHDEVPRPRPTFSEQIGLARDSLCRGVADQGRSRTICEGEGRPGGSPPHLSSSGSSNSNRGVFLENCATPQHRDGGQHTRVRVADGAHSQGHAKGDVDALIQERSGASDSTAGGIKRKNASTPATQQRGADSGIPERDERICTDEGDGGAEDPAVAALINGAKYPLPVCDEGIEVPDPDYFPVGLCKPPPIIKKSLDSFPTGLIVLEAVRRMAEEVGKDSDFLQWCTSGRKIADALSGPIPLPGPKSKIPNSFVSECVKSKVLIPLARTDRKKGAVCVFDVPKSDPQLRRLVVDGRPVNKRIAKPQPFSLVNPHKLATMLKVSNARFAQQTDLKGYFHQFPLSPEVSKYFCVQAGGRWFRWARLPMGFAYAPYIAQNTSEIFLGPILNKWGVVYLDDIFVWGAYPAEAAAKTAFVRDRLQRAGAEVNVKKSMAKPAEVVDFIGIVWNLPLQSFSLPEEWRLKSSRIIHDTLKLETCSLRKWWKVCGLVFRAAYVLDFKLCFLCHTLQFVRSKAQLVSRKKLSWDDDVAMHVATKEELAAFAVANIQTCVTVPFPSPPPIHFSIAVWTDASTTGWGWVSKLQNSFSGVERHGRWESTHTSGEMFVLELRAAEKGMAAALEGGHTAIVLFVDNEAVKYVLRRGHSRTRLGNSILRRMSTRLSAAKAHLHIRWIKTDEMPADWGSRQKLAGQGVSLSPNRFGHVVEEASGMRVSDDVLQ